MFAFTASAVIGSERRRAPQALKMALPSAGAITVTAGSPTPDVAAYLDMPPERRAAAKAHAAVLSAMAGKVALELPLSADVDDFRRVLVAEAKQP